MRRHVCSVSEDVPRKVRAGLSGLSEAGGAPSEGGSTGPGRPENAVDAGSVHSPPESGADTALLPPTGLHPAGLDCASATGFPGPPSAQGRSAGFSASRITRADCSS